MEEEPPIPLLSSTPADHTSNDAESFGSDNTNGFAVCSNFSSFDLHLTACSSPYTNSINNSIPQPSDFQSHNTKSNYIFSDELKNRNTVLNGQQFAANKLKNLDVLLDKRLIALLVLFVAVIVLYKMVIVTSEYLCVHISSVSYIWLILKCVWVCAYLHTNGCLGTEYKYNF